MLGSGALGHSPAESRGSAEGLPLPRQDGRPKMPAGTSPSASSLSIIVENVANISLAIS